MYISVNPLGGGNFLVTGFGFLASHVVHIRIVDVFMNTVSRQGTSTSEGHLHLQINVPCTVGCVLRISANDERRDPSTGDILWSNCVPISDA